MVIAAAIGIYSVAMGWERVSFPFAADDMMNLGHYFQGGPWCAVTAQFLVWKGYYRPMGAAFYLPLYHWFGLNPVPFQITILAILAVNAILVLRLALILGAGEIAASLAALVIAYPAGLTNLTYSIDMVYDVLCFLFFVGALVLYTRIRGEGRRLGWQETAAFLLLYLCALNSKEMALTMPLVLAGYEAWGPGARSREPGNAVVWITAFLAAVSLYGKKFGVEPLLDKAAYQPAFTLERFVGFQKAALHDLFAHWLTPGWRAVLVVWVLVSYLAWRRDRPSLRFSWAWMLVTPLPIAFLAGRVQGNLYIPLAGWAIFSAVVFDDLAQALAGVLAKEPLFRRFGRNGVLALLTAVTVVIWVNQMRYLRAAEVKPAAAEMGLLTADVIRQLRDLNPRVAPQSQVVFLNDPFEDWDMTFIGTLWFGDRSVHVYNQRKEHLSPGELERMDHVFDFRDGRLVQLK